MQNKSTPAISLIITCYNHGKYLGQAIESGLSQSLKAKEIIVVDDGSTDNTQQVATSYAGVKYIYQENQGLSAARNTGLQASTGGYIVFLDADDWLLQDALFINFSILEKHSATAFVSGSHVKVNAAGEVFEIAKTTPIENNYYHRLLHGNYIEMHATVMYQKWAFKKIRFDTALKSCEDYDVYLRITKLYSVIHHTNSIAAYRFHDQNMSSDYKTMLESALQVLHKQLDATNKSEKESISIGIHFFTDYYTKKIFKRLIQQVKYKQPQDLTEVNFLKRRNRNLYLKYKQHYLKYTLSDKLKAIVPTSILKLRHLYAISKEKKYLHYFADTKPASTQFGFDRGGPVDRYYIENFLERHSQFIRGRVLEIGDNFYTTEYGKEKVFKSDVLHVNAENQNATIVGDLSDCPNLPSDSFDCIVLTQTLHLIFDFQGAINTCFRVLKPGGSLLITVPGITPIDHGEWKDTWYWSFNQLSVAKLLSGPFATDKCQVQTFGNVFAASAFLYGLGMADVDKASLDYTDPHYQVIIAAIATKQFK